MRIGPAHQLARGGETCAAAIPFRQREDLTPLIDALRAHIARLEQSAAQFERRRTKAPPWGLGLPELDRHLPAQGLLRAGLHDVSPRSYGDQPAAMGFALALALCRLTDEGERRPLLWCRLAAHEREYGRLYGHGLERLGLPRHRFVTISLKKPASLLWTMEEALKSGAVAAVLGDADAAHADLTVTRRLSLAAAAGKAAAILTFARPDQAATASHTRWTAAATASRSPPHDAMAVGPPCWSIELTRARGGRPGAWILEWHHAQSRFSLVPGFSRRAIHPGTDQNGAEAATQGPALRAG
ncbi:ImuA family protein [Aestuariivirga sp.]|uniref:ImuA family protein n=1 Tax=Aestuariivirga sp. TaxID=2650926 RepID=UPI003BABDB24